MDETAKLIEPLIPALRRYAFALVRNHELADDLVQDCLERALSRWLMRHRDGDLRAWLFTILRNIFINDFHLRRRRGTTVQLDETTTPNVEPSQTASLEHHDLLAALNQLPEDQKSVLLLVGVEDFSYSDAAKILGVPLGTVMSRLSRARQKLRILIDTGCVVPLRRVK